jgi:F420-non-reducing hydrogenase iron-sulfur subunit
MAERSRVLSPQTVQTPSEEASPGNEVPGMKSSPLFTPELTAFTCIYCGYMAADTAGALHISYPSHIKLVRLPCTGKIDVQYLLDAFAEGADGVYLVACSLGNCHHVYGNERALARVKHTKEILASIGIEPERLDMFFVSGGMGATFAGVAKEMTERVRALGPSPVKLQSHAQGTDPLSTS